MGYGFVVRDAREGVQIPFRVLESSSDVACHLNNDLEFVYCNPAWDEFAVANEGEAAVFNLVQNSSVMDVVPDVLREFYEAVFNAARTAIVEFDYECSSPRVLRRFRMQILPNQLMGGLTILNSLMVEDPIDVARVAPGSVYQYVRESGLIEMCSHCRRSRRVGPQDTWDWVPAYLHKSVVNVSHGLCPICRAYFYGKNG